MLAASPRCAVFDLHNAPSVQVAQAIDTAAEPAAEPSLLEQFRDWRATAARGVTAPHETVTALLGAALEGGDGQGSSDLGVGQLHTHAHQVLNALGAAPARS